MCHGCDPKKPNKNNNNKTIHRDNRNQTVSCFFFFPFLKPQLQLQATAKLIQGLSQEWLHKTSNIGSRHQRMNKIWKDETEGKSIPRSRHGMQKGREVSENSASRKNKTDRKW